MSEDLTNDIRSAWVRHASLCSVPLGRTVRDVEREAGRQFDHWLDGIKAEARASGLTPQQAERLDFANEFNELAGGGT